eukprot:85026-Rhodomonas_salina.2
MKHNVLAACASTGGSGRGARTAEARSCASTAGSSGAVRSAAATRSANTTGTNYSFALPGTRSSPSGTDMALALTRRSIVRAVLTAWYGAVRVALTCESVQSARSAGGRRCASMGGSIRSAGYRPTHPLCHLPYCHMLSPSAPYGTGVGYRLGPRAVLRFAIA